MYVGSDDADRRTDAYIGEIVYYQSALSAADLTSLRTYLVSKWSPPPSPPKILPPPPLSAPPVTGSIVQWLDAQNSYAVSNTSGSVLKSWRALSLF